MNLHTLTLTTPYLELEEELYHFSNPLALDMPYLVAGSKKAIQLLGLNEDTLNTSEFLALHNGEFLPKGAKPFSMGYAGHQFGHYNPYLGDGRAHNLGNVNGWNLQLKGSGETFYARSADGRASLRSSIREFLMSEAMYHLGIPTTRALGVIGSETEVLRNGIEKAGMVLRLSESWVRFGSFEYLYYTKEYAKLESLAEFVIKESFSHLQNDEDRFYKIFAEVVKRTAKLIAKWQGVGFCHGVMNTDNMSIIGVTLDYGPFAMLDDFNFGYVCNQSDKVGRYSYGAQPNVAYWNLTMLAKALTPILPQHLSQQLLDAYGEYIYPNAYIEEMREKLGLFEKLDEDTELITELVGAMQDAYVDNTLFFRTLSHYNGNREALYDICMEPIVIHNWLELYDTRLLKENTPQDQREKFMLTKNPKYVLKNYMLEKAITKSLLGDFSEVEKLLFIASHPFDELEEYEEYSQETPEIYKNIGLSCSS
ncbi:MAG: YdiU family protein [Campylobacterales bacterium]|nr:YdiU family protein [Campylobacterales bacterium]